MIYEDLILDPLSKIAGRMPTRKYLYGEEDDDDEEEPFKMHSTNQEVLSCILFLSTLLRHPISRRNGILHRSPMQLRAFLDRNAVINEHRRILRSMPTRIYLMGFLELHRKPLGEARSLA